MKKLFLSILFAGLLLAALGGPVFAAGSGDIIEVPDVKIIMDGRLTEYKDVPICIGQSTLLPLREMLVNLGVENDDDHIVYNNEEKSVTIYKDETKIFLAVGSETAYVNDTPVKLNVAPVGYEKNQRIYIPFRFVAETLGKKVIWDGSANAILLCDIERYDSIKQILDRSDEAMKQIGKYRMALDVKASVKSKQITMNMGISAESQIDIAQKLMSMYMTLNMLGMEIKMDTYYGNNASYSMDFLTQEWQKQTYLPEEYDLLFTSQSNTDMLEANESLCAGLTQEAEDKPGEILLKGDVFLNELFEKAMASQESGNLAVSGKDTEYDTFYVEISLDSSTYLINSIVMHTKLVQTENGETVTTDMEIKVQYADYDGDFEVVIPGEIIKNAVEIQSTAL